MALTCFKARVLSAFLGLLHIRFGDRDFTARVRKRREIMPAPGTLERRRLPALPPDAMRLPDESRQHDYGRDDSGHGGFTPQTVIDPIPCISEAT
jgi:hypothetical protein